MLRADPTRTTGPYKEGVPSFSGAFAQIIIGLLIGIPVSIACFTQTRNWWRPAPGSFVGIGSAS